MGIRDTEIFVECMHHLKPGDDISPVPAGSLRDFLENSIETALEANKWGITFEGK